MPAGNGTGPLGEGPLTGRSMGRCTDLQTDGYMSAPGKRGAGEYFRCGRGSGRGMRNRFYETGLPFWRRYQQHNPLQNTEFAETDSLKRQLQNVADTLEHIASRVKQLIEQRKG
ncbi:MAG: DUF5320 domain-containing protein [Candidatus Fermentibacteraceae bacterium]|nr:DUF5320 domain-containing protein [Candidatus Fermentibacteraceae bacterium]